MNMAAQNYIRIKNLRKDKVEVFDETVNELYLFTINKKNICVRKEGNVVFDKNWKKAIKTSGQKEALKEFLGGMYIAEMDKEIRAGNFMTARLNAK